MTLCTARPVCMCMDACLIVWYSALLPCTDICHLMLMLLVLLVLPLLLSP